MEKIQEINEWKIFSDKIENEALKQIIVEYCGKLVEFINNGFFSGDIIIGAISIREDFLRHIYGISSSFFNRKYCITKNDYPKNFVLLNDVCFSAESSYYQTDIINKKLPVVSDILPVIDKSFVIMQKNKDWKDIFKETFDFLEEIDNPISIETNDDFSVLKEKVSKIINANRENKKYCSIQTIISDYIKIGEPTFRNEQIKEVFTKTFIMYELHLSQGYDFFIYYPIKTTYKGSISVMLWLKYENFKKPSDFSLFFNKYLKLINSSLSHKIFCNIYDQALTYALCSAVAAIMARNMSHNIGSHVLANIVTTSNIIKQNEIRVFERYLQQRVDFIAQITTEIPEWTYSCWFYKELMRNFYYQKLLLDYIASSEGLKPFEYIGTEQKERLKINFVGNDCLVTIPGGIVGQHAFYIILEDIIRNSAKHNWAKLEKTQKQNKNLEITVKVDNNPQDNYVTVTIYDNISEIKNDYSKDLPENWNTLSPEDIKSIPLHQRMNYYLVQNLIDESGKLKKSNWGLAEMKICAGYLRRIGGEEIGMGQEKVLDIIKAVAVNDNGQYRLGYSFKILKPKEVLIVGYSVNNEELKQKLKHNSIYVEETLPRDRDYKFCVLVDNGNIKFINDLKTVNNKKELLKELETLPYRLFIVKDDNSQWDISDEPFKSRIVLLSKNEFEEKIKSNAEEFKLYLYEKWIQHLAGLRGKKDKVSILIKLSGGDVSSSTPIDELLQGLNNEIKNQLKDQFGLDENYIPETVPGNLRTGGNSSIKNSSIEPRRSSEGSGLISVKDPPQTTSKIYLTNTPSADIIYARHKALSSVEFSPVSCLYFESLSGAAQHFILLNQPPTDGYYKQKLLYQLVENGLIKIGICDERFAQSSILTIKDAGEVDYGSYLRASQVYVIDEFENYKIENVQTNYVLRINNHQIKIIKKDTAIEQEITDNKFKLDFLIIHQGILDKLNKTKEEIEDILDSLKEKIPFIVVTSGRGKPENIPDNVKFLPFSNIESTLMVRPHSKFILTQILMSLIKGNSK